MLVFGVGGIFFSLGCRPQNRSAGSWGFRRGDFLSHPNSMEVRVSDVPPAISWKKYKFG
jgi:hypothetical protein